MDVFGVVFHAFLIEKVLSDDDLEKNQNLNSFPRWLFNLVLLVVRYIVDKIVCWKITS